MEAIQTDPKFSASGSNMVYGKYIYILAVSTEYILLCESY